MSRVGFDNGRTRWPMALGMVLPAVFLIVVVGVSVPYAAQAPQTAESGHTAPQASSSSSEPAQSLTSAGGQVEGYLAGGRWREGSKLVDVQGQFKFSGDRVTFYSVDGKTHFACLENLNSERVFRIIEESPEVLDWTVQGTLTEYASENYLLVTQAVIRGRAGRNSRAAADLSSPQ